MVRYGEVILLIRVATFHTDGLPHLFLLWQTAEDEIKMVVV
jgi:hypothetical protein